MERGGWECTKEQRENMRQASIKRESTIRRKVSIKGVVYPNMMQAANATGLSARTIARYCVDDSKPDHFFIQNTKENP